MKYQLLTTVLFVFVLVSGCEGPKGPTGPQGPQGVQGEPGEDGAMSATEVMTAVKDNDGSGSGVDADLLDGVELATLTSANSAVEYKADANTASIDDIKSKEVVVFDGGGRELGKLINITSDSLLYFDADLGLVVEVFTDTLGDSDDIQGVQDFHLYFLQVDCDQGRDMLTKYSKSNMGLLDQNTGIVYKAGAPESCNLQTRRSRRDLITGACENTGDINEEFCSYNTAKTLSPFTSGVYYGARD